VRPAVGNVLAFIKSAPVRAYRALGEGAVKKILAVLTVVCVLGGIALRVRGYLIEPTGLWLDEASWAMRLFTRPLVESRLRPIGFLAISKLLAVVFSPSEVVLRAMPWTAGIAAVVLSPFLARRLFTGPASRLLFVAIIAFNPCAVDFAKEFKPYSIALALHLALMHAVLRYLQDGGGRALALPLVLAVGGSLFSQDLVLAFPGVFLLLAWEARKRSRRELAFVVGAALTILLGLATQYFVMWRHLPKESSEFWGNKYDVFHTAQHARSYLSWAIERYLDVVSMPGIRRTLWESELITPEDKQLLRLGDRYVWLWLHAIGISVLFARRRFREATLLLLPLCLLWLFNRIGFWPLGAFRTNVFTVAYTSALAAAAFDAPGGDSERWFAPVPALVLVGLPLVLFEPNWGKQKRTFTYDSDFPKVVERLAHLRKPMPEELRDQLVLDRRSCDPWLYYTRYHPKLAQQLGPSLQQSYTAHCLTDDDTQMAEALETGVYRGRRVWVVLHTTQLINHLRRSGDLRRLRIVENKDLGSHTLMAFVRRR